MLSTGRRCMVLGRSYQQHHYRLAGRTFSKGNSGQHHILKTHKGQLATAAASLDDKDSQQPALQKKKTFFDRFLGPQSCVAKEGTNRWAMILPAFATHMCIGSPWAWSVLTPAVATELGFVSQAAMDWSFAEATYPMSAVFVLQGLMAALAGKWQMKVGARSSLATAAAFFGGGVMLGGVGLMTHSLPLLYGGYGVLGGIGVGLAYTPPIQALMNWFPDKKGLAGGLVIAGFGSGALAFSPAVSYLREKFQKVPEFVGSLTDVRPEMQDGRLFADVAGKLTEVVEANVHDIAQLSNSLSHLEPGYYAVGTGSTGSGMALVCLGATYLAIMGASSLAIKTPPPGYVPEGYTAKVASGAVAQQNVALDTVMRTPQFWLLGATFFSIACGGMGVMSVAKPMMAQVFSSHMPELVTASFASSYVMSLAAGNLGGRIAWGVLSDKIGRRASFHAFTLGSIPLYMSVPYFIDTMLETGASWPLYGFIGTTVAAISSMGGTYAILPAYEADLFGSKYVGPIHGRFMLASSVAAVAGPSMLLALRSSSEAKYIADLLAQADPEAFRAKFGAPMSAIEELTANKAITISKLMDIMPGGVMDPSPYIYHSTMHTLAGVMGAAAIAHLAVGPVAAKYLEQAETIINVTGKEKK